MPGNSVFCTLALCAGCAVSALWGCQSYSPAPIDLAAHREIYAAREHLLQSGDAFADRLRSLGVSVPDRFDVRDGIALPEAEAIALIFNPDLRLARRRAGVTSATEEHAGLWEDPEFGFNGTELLSPTGPFQFEFMLNLTLPVSGRLEAERARAGAAHEAELRKIIDQEWTTRFVLRVAWAAWTIAEERASLHGQAIEALNELADTSAELESMGELSRVDGRMVRLELLQRRLAHQAAEAEAERARRGLLTLMGLPVDARLNLLPGLPRVPAPEEWGARTDGGSTSPAISMDERLIAANTTLAVRRAEYIIAEESLRLEVRKQYPDITIGGGYGSEDNDDRLLLGVSLPIPVLNANRGGIAVARAQRDLARADAEAEFERLASRLGDLRSVFNALQAQRLIHESQVLPMVDEQMADLERLARLGEWNTLLLIDAAIRQIEAKTRLLELRLDELHAAIAIEQLLGPAANAAQPGNGEQANTTRNKETRSQETQDHTPEGAQS